VADSEARVWSFAEIPAKRENMMIDAMAPDFEVKDRQGKVVRMADLKGKKALIVTWSSW
jgi:cytochrome oxidase Cu insertion factor (SCO1/SenC/PrrC family)